MMSAVLEIKSEKGFLCRCLAFMVLELSHENIEIIESVYIPICPRCLMSSAAVTIADSSPKLLETLYQPMA